MAGLAHLLTFLAAGMNTQSPPDSSGERHQKLPSAIDTGEFAQSCSQALCAMFGLRAALEAKGDRG